MPYTIITIRSERNILQLESLIHNYHLTVYTHDSKDIENRNLRKILADLVYHPPLHNDIQ